jgi:hypothetical protein
MHFAFSSIGGGVHLALLIFRASSVLSSGYDLVIALPRLVCLVIIFLRGYWMYLNTIMFFAPFDSLKLFSLDVMIFLGGGIAIMSVGHSAAFFSTACVTAPLMWIRVWYTKGASVALQRKYPTSYAVFQRRIKGFLWGFSFATAFVILSAALLLTWPHMEIPINTLFTLLSLIMAFLFVEPFYPVEDDS